MPSARGSTAAKARASRSFCSSWCRLATPTDGDADADVDAVDTLLLCSGRVTWDLKVERTKREDGGRVAIARLEQLYPRPVDQIRAEIEKFPNLKAIRWVQDEPLNMGPWPHYMLNVWPELGEQVGIKIAPITRDSSASPSVGVAKRHQEEQKDLMARAFEAVDPRAEAAEQY